MLKQQVRKRCIDSSMEEAVEAVYAHPRFTAWIEEADTLIDTSLVLERAGAG